MSQTLDFHLNSEPSQKPCIAAQIVLAFSKFRPVCNTKALDLERLHVGHGHFPDPAEIPIRKIGDLGIGASGSVECVISTISHREYAPKRIRRGPIFRKDKKVLREFESELSKLKMLSHGHNRVIDLVGSFTEPKYVGILFPVADCNLAEFLCQPDLGHQRWLLRTWFGCLSSALGYLHENKIRHKDIKPQNILVSIDWTSYGQITTNGPTAMNPRYCAPEVTMCEPHNSSSNIWTLGCVFVEILSVLKGATIKELTMHFTLDGQVLPYHSTKISIQSWVDQVAALPGWASDNTPAIWIGRMLERSRQDRWSARLLMESIRDCSIESSAKYSYIGICC